MLGYIVVDTESNRMFLQKLLQADLGDMQIEWIGANSKSHAISLAGTLLAVKQHPVYLIFNLDTTDNTQIRDELRVIRTLLDNASGNTRFDILGFVPELEMLFFHNQKLAEQIFQGQFTDEEWALSQVHPKQMIQTLSGADAVSLLDHILTNQFEALRQHPLPQSICTFFQNENILA